MTQQAPTSSTPRAPLTSGQREAVQRVVDANRKRPGPLLEVLHGIQAAIGFIPPAAVPVIADELNLSRAEVHGVVSFYHYFRQTPAGKHLVRVCRAESCQAAGGDALADHARQRLGVDFHQTTADGHFSLDPVYCLGNCACSPAIMIGEELHGRVSAAQFDALIADCERQR
jgi:formate dehydrogenase subunit gamma